MYVIQCTTMDLDLWRRELPSSETRPPRVQEAHYWLAQKGLWICVGPSELEPGIEVQGRGAGGVRRRGNEEPGIPHHELPAKQASDSSGF